MQVCARRSVVGLIIWNKSSVQYMIEETQIYGIKYGLSVLKRFCIM